MLFYLWAALALGMLLHGYRRRALEREAAHALPFGG